MRHHPRAPTKHWGGTSASISMVNRNQIMRNKFGFAGIAFLLGVASVPGVAAEATMLDEIIVTARKIPENLLRTPVSVSVLTERDLSGAGVRTIFDGLPLLPNLSVPGGIAQSLQGQIGIRGISTLQRNIGVESGIGIFIDGVYQGRSDTYLQPFLDVSSLEVIRGPQGTMFGKNTIAGAVNITTLMPEAKPQRQILAEVGNYGLARVQASARGPLTTDIGAKLSVGYVGRGGTYSHLSGGPDGDEIDLLSARTAFVFDGGSGTRVVLAGDALRDRGRPAYFQSVEVAGYPNNPMASRPHVIDPDGDNYLHRDNHGLSLTVSHEMDKAALVAITAYRRAEYQASLDDDQSLRRFLSKDAWSDRTDFITQEFRVDGTIGTRLTYVSGLFYLNQSVDTDRVLALGPDFGLPVLPALKTVGGMDTQTVAMFGNADYVLTDRIMLSLGVRYDWERKNVDFDQIDESGILAAIGFPSLSYDNKAEDRSLSPTIAARYDIDQDMHAYARIARGFKGSAFNVDLASKGADLAAGPERAITYEAGLKALWLDQQVRVSGALFQTDYDDIQVSQLLGSGPSLDNAAKANIRGAELEVTARITTGLTASASLGLLDPTYDRYTNCSVPLSLGGGSADCSGNRIVAASTSTYAATVDYVYPVNGYTVTTRAQYMGASGAYMDATNADRFKTTGYDVVNASLSLSRDDWEIRLWAKNIFDQVYTTYHDDRSTVGVGKTTAYGDPRTYGLTLSTRL